MVDATGNHGELACRIGSVVAWPASDTSPPPCILLRIVGPGCDLNGRLPVEVAAATFDFPIARHRFGFEYKHPSSLPGLLASRIMFSAER